MDYLKELNFMLNVYKKSNLSASLIEHDKGFNGQNEDNITDFFDSVALFKHIVPLLKEGIIYKYRDPFMRSYRFVLLPNSKTCSALCVGPFLNESLSKKQILELCEKNKFSPSNNRSFIEYFASLPIIAENSPLLIILLCFCENLWENKKIKVIDFSKQALLDAPFTKSILNPQPNESLVDEKTIEKRYQLENQLIRAVSHGQMPLLTTFNSAVFSEVLENRSANPLQNAKNYSIIMNTLLRKGAEQGGVHPVYINQISSDFAYKIENLSSSSSVNSLMGEMMQSYCRLVRKHNTKNYPLIVQKTILTIDADISNNLSTKQLANIHGVSLGYLSAVFKKATGQTVTEYIFNRRMEYAEYLLTTSKLQIQTIATLCGIIDTQYFSKLFKKHKGTSPLQFRNKAQSKVD